VRPYVVPRKLGIRSRYVPQQSRRKALVDYAARPEPSLSLPIRMEQKSKRTKAGTASIIAGVALSVGAAYNFSRSGSELVASYLTVLAVGFIAMGIALHIKASKMR
jgi:hypothetical protein